MGSPAIFSGSFVKFLKSNLNFFDKAYILTGTQDPRVTATTAPKGSIMMRQTLGGNGQVFRKLDDGLSTNWEDLGFVGTPTADYYNPISSSLPATGHVTIDGQTLEYKDKVLFSALTGLDPNNRIYEAEMSGTPAGWVTRASAADNDWNSVVWSPELSLFVAVASSGSGNRVMTSPDGITWSPQISAANLLWQSVCWSPELSLFVAVAYSGTSNSIMTSPDGLTWSPQTSPTTTDLWYSVCWSPELSLFVAVAFTGSSGQVMTSPDGMVWAQGTAAAASAWHSVCWSPELNLFVAVGGTGTGVMTSPDGFAWTSRNAAASNDWLSITWSSELGLFAAVSDTGSDRAMTSPDGLTWTSRTAAANLLWHGITWASDIGLFIAAAQSGSGNRIMVSSDGVTWTSQTSSVDNFWQSVAWSPSLLRAVAVGNLTGVGNRVMTDNYVQNIAWVPLELFNGGLDIASGEVVRILRGTNYQGQEVYFNQNEEFVINDTIRLFDGPNGTDFWELGSIKTATLLDNTISPTNVFEVGYAGSQNWVIPYSLIRDSGANKETGQLYISTNGTTVAITRNNAYFGDTGVTFTADISGSLLRLRYTTSSSGSDAVMKFFSMRWSDSAGGPTGVPSYTNTNSLTPAAGNTGDVQYKGVSGNLDASDDFKWDTAEEAINLNGLLIGMLQGPEILLDNQVSPQTIFQYLVANQNAVIEYSLDRDGNVQTGRLLVATNGTLVSLSDDFVATAATGITFTASIALGYVKINYTSTNTGFNANMKYSIRKWQ